MDSSSKGMELTLWLSQPFIYAGQFLRTPHALIPNTRIYPSVKGIAAVFLGSAQAESASAIGRILRYGNAKPNSSHETIQFTLTCTHNVCLAAHACAFVVISKPHSWQG